MFTVAQKALAESSQDMQKIIRDINRQMEQTEDIVSSIRRISAYSGVIRTLKIHLENMNTERRQMMDMMAALNEIQQMYFQCERRITDYGDQVQKVNYYRGMKSVSLHGIRDYILDYHIR